MSRLRELGTPIFWAEGHPGILKRDSWEVEVSGLCDRPKIFSWDELSAMPKSVVDARLTSVTRFSVRGLWGGIRLSDMFNEVSARPDTRYVRFWSYRSIYDTCVSIDIARQDRMLLAYEFDGDALEEDYGGPIRVFCPYLWGYKSAKSVIKVELTTDYVSGFWEIRGYSDDAKITAGRVRDMNSGRNRPIPNGEVVRFLDE